MTPPTKVRYQDLLESVPCNLCGADDYTVLIPPAYDRAGANRLEDIFRSSGDEILVDRLVRCNRCGLQYLNPRVRQDLIVKAYASGTDEMFVSQVEARERTFDRCIREIEKFAPQKGRLYDIGTGSGAFPGVASRRGWVAAGCEPNRWLAAWATKRYGIPIAAGTLFDQQLKSSTFDVVTLWDVLEHTPDPKSVLRECHRITKPGGLLVLNYPDIGSWIAKWMGRRWVFLLSVHLYYFTAATATRMLLETGFQPIVLRHHWQTLELGYILFRMRPYVGKLAQWGESLTKRLGIHMIPIPYWLGQERIIARKNTQSS